jgi:hypothetical protein
MPTDLAEAPADHERGNKLVIRIGGDRATLEQLIAVDELRAQTFAILDLSGAPLRIKL